MSGDNPNTVIQKYESVTRGLLNDYAPCSNACELIRSMKRDFFHLL